MQPRFWPRSGADVVKIEPIRGGDPFRRGVDVGSPYFVQYNAGKRSLAVDLKKPDGIALVKTLLPKFDVLIENSRPGKMDALGLGHADCIAINPRLIYSSASGFGDGGPYRDRAAYDSMGQSMGAYYSIMNNAGAPRLTGTCIADLITAIVATMGILASLVGRGLDPEQRGTLTQTSLLEAMSTITIDAMTQMTETGDDPDSGIAPSAGAEFLPADARRRLAHAAHVVVGEILAGARPCDGTARTDRRPALPHLLRPHGQLFRTEAHRRGRVSEIRPGRVGRAADPPRRTVRPGADDAGARQRIRRRSGWRCWSRNATATCWCARPGGSRANAPAGRSIRPHIGEHSREIALEALSPSEVDRLLREGVIHQAGAQTRAAKVASAVGRTHDRDLT